MLMMDARKERKPACLLISQKKSLIVSVVGILCFLFFVLPYFWGSAKFSSYLGSSSRYKPEPSSGFQKSGHANIQQSPSFSWGFGSGSIPRYWKRIQETSKGFLPGLKQFPDQCRNNGVIVKRQHAEQGLNLTQYGPFPYLDDYRNPCWLEGQNKSQLRCLPYFYLAGFPKCGTTDMYERLIRHPNIMRAPKKEPHWITRYRFKAGKDKLDFYTNFFAKSLEGTNKEDHIVGDCSTSTFWDNHKWYMLPGNENCTEPQIINTDYIRHLNPNTKVIVMLRNPTSRLYSEYMYFDKEKKSPERFHNISQKQISDFNNCLKDRSLRHCVYNSTVANEKTRLKVGLYAVYIEDWLLRFPSDQLLFISLTDVGRDIVGTMLKVFDFLNLPPPGEDSLNESILVKKQNVGKAAMSMQNETKVLLDKFYQPYNKWLATILGDKRYALGDF